MKARTLTLVLILAMSQAFAQFTLSPLQYPYNAMEPYIDQTTMQIHHDVHHQAYVNNLNAALKDYPDYQKKTIAELMTIQKLPASVQTAVRNNGGGHYNHSLFWTLLAPANTTSYGGAIATAIDKTFGSLEKFQAEFEKAATSRFGSGWAWLIVKKDGSLKIISTPNQDNPLMDIAEEKGTPVLAVDVWEHAYYLKYQSKRADYLKAFWNVVNWNEVNKLYTQATK